MDRRDSSSNQPMCMSFSAHMLPRTPANYATNIQSYENRATPPSYSTGHPETPAAPDSGMAPPVPNPTPPSAVGPAPVVPQIRTGGASIILQSFPAVAGLPAPPTSMPPLPKDFPTLKVSASSLNALVKSILNILVFCIICIECCCFI